MRMYKIEPAYCEALSHSDALHLIHRVQANIQRQFDSAFDASPFFRPATRSAFRTPELPPRRPRGANEPD
jgi:hypothetical protein